MLYGCKESALSDRPLIGATTQFSSDDPIDGGHQRVVGRSDRSESITLLLSRRIQQEIDDGPAVVSFMNRENSFSCLWAGTTLATEIMSLSIEAIRAS